MKIGSLFSGIGGLELGIERGLARAGIEAHTVYQVERSAYCRHILARHWPAAQRYDDVTTVGASVLPSVDILCGGFPCQDVSAAGRGEGIGTADQPTERSGLWWQFARIIAETRPQWVVIENVASGARRWLPAVRRTLWTRGYDSVPLGIAACEVGARHRRERLFVLARLADVDHDSLRLESGRSSGAQGDAPHPDRPRLAVRQRLGGDPQSPDEATAERDPGAISPGFGLPPRPWMVRGVHGVPPGLDSWRAAGWTPARVRTARIHALGNAVVPAQAEPVGHLIGHLTTTGA
jgi:DNA (cytosine-5)-methyltransferase 1